MNQDIPLDDMQDYNVACHTSGCKNEDIMLRVPATVVDPFIVCGPCGVQITDIVKIEP